MLWYWLFVSCKENGLVAYIFGKVLRERWNSFSHSFGLSCEKIHDHQKSCREYRAKTYTDLRVVDVTGLGSSAKALPPSEHLRSSEKYCITGNTCYSSRYLPRIDEGQILRISPSICATGPISGSRLNCMAWAKKCRA